MDQVRLARIAIGHENCPTCSDDRRWLIETLREAWAANDTLRLTHENAMPPVSVGQVEGAMTNGQKWIAWRREDAAWTRHHLIRTGDRRAACGARLPQEYHRERRDYDPHDPGQGLCYRCRRSAAYAATAGPGINVVVEVIR